MTFKDIKEMFSNPEYHGSQAEDRLKEFPKPQLYYVMLKYGVIGMLIMGIGAVIDMFIKM